jgi:hypothetical protein
VKASATKEEKLAAIRGGATAEVGPHIVGRHKVVKGHHPHQQAARSNNSNYSGNDALSVKDDGSYSHKEISKAQAKLNADLRKKQQGQSLLDEEGVQSESMQHGRIKSEHAEEILDLSREILKDMDALDPTRIPGQRKGM